jgi:hypothetical protein
LYCAIEKRCHLCPLIISGLQRLDAFECVPKLFEAVASVFNVRPQDKTTGVLQKTIGLDVSGMKGGVCERITQESRTQTHRPAFGCQFESDAIARQEAVHVGVKLS